MGRLLEALNNEPGAHPPSAEQPKRRRNALAEAKRYDASLGALPVMGRMVDSGEASTSAPISAPAVREQLVHRSPAKA